MSWFRIAKSYILVLGAMMFAPVAFSQETPLHAVWFGGGLDFGAPFTKYEASKNILKSRFPAYQINGRFSVRYIFMDRFGLELGAVQHFQHLNLTDKDFLSRYSGFKLKMKNEFYYTGLNASLFYRQPLQPGIYAYGLIGYCWNFVGNEELSETKNFIKGNEDISMTSNYASTNNAYLFELGIQNELFDRHTITYSLQYNHGINKLVDGQYQIASGENILTKNAFTSKGSYLGFSIKYHYLLFKKDQPEKSFEPVTIKLQPPTAKPTGKLPQPVELPVKLKGRKLIVTHRIVVDRPNVTIKVWDHEEIDGDIVSLNLNENWLIENYELKKEPKVIPVVLHFGANKLISHAINLGQFKPNTAAISIFDGTKEQKVILESDMNTSSVIEIVYYPEE